ncbi:MAG: hypothetical protein JRF39_14225 [Deltaproteobacteria bacterium]|nr:hypothetical protein [Deltaproteobacteria bacterium]
MTDIFIWARFVVLAASALLLIWALIKLKSNGSSGVEPAIREELRFGREESAKAARNLREEVSAGQKSSMDTVVKTIGEMRRSQSDQRTYGVEYVGARDPSKHHRCTIKASSGEQ